MGPKLARWLLFGVLMALLPLAYNLLHVVTRGGKASVENLTGHGELLLVAAAISAAAIGELVASGPKAPIGKIVSGGGALLVLGFASLYFADVAWAEKTGEKLLASVVCNTSVVLFASAFVASLACVALSEVK
jgi:hypothetical protein